MNRTRKRIHLSLKKVHKRAERRRVINIARILQNLIGLAEVSIIKNTFIKAFLENGVEKADGTTYLHGNFNVTGAKSGRLSSSGPNLTNLPSTGTKFAKPVKACFRAPPGWLFAGADFYSLEDRISALTTKDPNKLRVYTDGYDGHSLRSFSYYPERLPGIVNTVKSINSIAYKFPEVRQDSKGPTFCLTYKGTKHALINQCGLAPDVAEQVEIAYHDMYKVSDDWVNARIKQAGVDGFITGAFGLRLRTPILQQVLLGKRSTPYAAEAEARTAGNMLGQSYCMLNNRASNAFMEKVWTSEYAEDIKVVAWIHDANYYLIRDSMAVLKFVNDNLIKEMEWQGLPEIQHPTIGLGGELEVYYPNWAYSTVIPNYISKEEIKGIFN